MIASAAWAQERDEHAGVSVTQSVVFFSVVLKSQGVNMLGSDSIFSNLFFSDACEVF